MDTSEFIEILHEEQFYGYGWGVRFKDGKKLYVRHTGNEDWLAHNSVMCLYENGDAYIVLSNAGTSNDDYNEPRKLDK